MKLEPLDRFRPKPYAILYPGRRSMEVQSADGLRVAHGKRDVEELLKSLAGCSGSPDPHYRRVELEPLYLEGQNDESDASTLFFFCGEPERDPGSF